MKTETPFLYPSVTSIPKKSGDSQNETKKTESGPSEFDQMLDMKLEPKLKEKALDLGAVRSPLKLSSHASQRLNERQIKIDSQTWAKVSDAVDRAEAKGIEDTLVLTADAALIVNVKNRTVITAMDKGSLAGNVFTNIDGAVIV